MLLMNFPEEGHAPLDNIGNQVHKHGLPKAVDDVHDLLCEQLSDARMLERNQGLGRALLKKIVGENQADLAEKAKVRELYFRRDMADIARRIVWFADDSLASDTEDGFSLIKPAQNSFGRAEWLTAWRLDDKVRFAFSEGPTDRPGPDSLDSDHVTSEYYHFEPDGTLIYDGIQKADGLFTKTGREVLTTDEDIIGSDSRRFAEQMNKYLPIAENAFRNRFSSDISAPYFATLLNRPSLYDAA